MISAELLDIFKRATSRARPPEFMVEADAENVCVMTLFGEVVAIFPRPTWDGLVATQHKRSEP